MSQSEIVVLYRKNDHDSFEFANYYINKHNLSNNCLLAVPCNNVEILNSYEDFLYQIELPIFDKLYENVDIEYTLGNLKYIIVGYNVPGGFKDGDDVVSSTSRLSRLNFEYNKKENNPIYNPSILDFTEQDFQQIIICSRIDADSLDAAKKIVDNGIIVAKKNIVNGKFYFDKVNKISYEAWSNNLITNEFKDNDSTLSESEKNYYDLLSNFENECLVNLNVEVVKTVAWDRKTDVPIFRLKDDSFVWAFSSNRVGSNFFTDNIYSRFFCYNADDSSGLYLKNKANLWCKNALDSGYACCAGSMSDPSPEGYLNPIPFFYSLLEGMNIGQAFYKSIPFSNWTISLFGDPLLKVKFNKTNYAVNTVSEIRVLYDIANNIANSMAYSIGRRNYAKNIVDAIANINDLNVKNELFIPAANLYGKINALTLTYYYKLLFDYFNYSPSLDLQLTNNNFKISPLLTEISGVSSISIPNLFQSEEWIFETEILKLSSSFSRYHFIAEFSLNENFSNVFLSTDSQLSQDGWFYEKETNKFEKIKNLGVSSNYAGKKVKYIASIPISRGIIYYVRYRQKDNLGKFSDWKTATRIGNN